MAQAAFDVFCKEILRLDKVARQYESSIRSSAEHPAIQATQKLQKLRQKAENKASIALEAFANDAIGQHALIQVRHLSRIYTEQFNFVERRRAMKVRRQVAEARQAAKAHQAAEARRQMAEARRLALECCAHTPSLGSPADDLCFCAELLLKVETVTICANCWKATHSKCLLRYFDENKTMKCPYCRALMKEHTREPFNSSSST